MKATFVQRKPVRISNSHVRALAIVFHNLGFVMETTVSNNFLNY